MSAVNEKCWSVLLQLFLLNEAAVVLVNDLEGRLDIVGGLLGQATGSKELLVVEGVGSWNIHFNTVSTRPAA